ncbi:FIG00645039: hypothetical protein with HTH-domain [hydrothermal vent metagenome]|uniref:Nucleotidyl transferase AbiEii/AbiGii toxin family protein n=1 Tax=hydrothermal vent metagenome TaxID=652676 RepID=A0A3B0VDM2_9ZZZZ
MSNDKKNIAASVRQRLLDKSRKDNRPFSELLQYFTMERFLFRLADSPHIDKFILKGALMLWVWQSPMIRATMDIDMLASYTSNDIEQVLALIREICVISTEDDGLQFDLDSIKGEHITEDADYKGVRVRFVAWLDKAVVNMQIDIGFGDIVVPGPRKAELPAMLDFKSPEIMCYSLESTIAEKFETMVKLGELNSRMKDFYDIWLLSRQFNFDGTLLQTAITKTMNNRGTTLPLDISAFSDEFIQIKSPQWKAFINKLKQEIIPKDFMNIVHQIEIFLLPIVNAINSGKHLAFSWTAPGPWQAISGIGSHGRERGRLSG